MITVDQIDELVQRGYTKEQMRELIQASLLAEWGRVQQELALFESQYVHYIDVLESEEGRPNSQKR